ncbi:MAG: hypothetical protein ABH870_02345 [bacterium]
MRIQVVPRVLPNYSYINNPKGFSTLFDLNVEKASALLFVYAI